MQALPPGAMIDRYRIETVLSAGGFGRIYRARHVVLDRVVALKVLRPERTSEEDLQRFLREARIAAACSSEHVVQIFDGGRIADGSPFLAMELLEGSDLGTVLASRGRLSVEESLPIVQQMLAGLGAVHAQGVVHRDLKPANIFLSPGRGGKPLVKLLDFGISKFLRRISLLPLTDTGITVGTPLYMAPEQLYDSREADHRADLFCCGAILFKMLCGDAPREAALGRAGPGRFLDPAPPLLTVAPDVPPLLAEVIDKSLLNDPSARFEDATAMWSAIERAARGEPALRPSLPTLREVGVMTATEPNLEAHTPRMGGASGVESVNPVARAEKVFERPRGRPVSVPPQRKSRREMWLLASTVLLAASVAVLMVAVVAAPPEHVGTLTTTAPDAAFAAPASDASVRDAHTVVATHIADASNDEPSGGERDRRRSNRNGKVTKAERDATQGAPRDPVATEAPIVPLTGPAPSGPHANLRGVRLVHIPRSDGADFYGTEARRTATATVRRAIGRMGSCRRSEAILTHVQFDVEGGGDILAARSNAALPDPNPEATRCVAAAIAAIDRVDEPFRGTVFADIELLPR